MARKKEQAENMASVISDITNTPEAKEEEAQRLDTMQTRGVKGLKLERFNASFSPENMQYLKVMSALTGDTMTNYLNSIVTRDREANADTYKQAEKLIEKLRK